MKTQLKHSHKCLLYFTAHRAHILILIMITIFNNSRYSLAFTISSQKSFTPTTGRRIIHATPHSHSHAHAHGHPIRIIMHPHHYYPCRISSPLLFLANPKNDDNDNDDDSSTNTNKNNEDTINTRTRTQDGSTIGLDPIMILPIATISTIGLLIIGVIYTKMTNPIVDFDVDFYMALDGVRGNYSSGGDALDSDTIVGLPKYSPAEQLVGALFGPK